MTWEQLKAHIEVMDDEQQKTDATVYDANLNEYFFIQDIDFAPETDVLDKNHPFLVFGKV